MTRDITPDLKKIRLFMTEPHDCSYLPGRQAKTAFVDPSISMDTDLYTRLTHMGFRRSGRFLYTPRCATCNTCIPVRVPADQFKATRQQRRCLKNNRDLSLHATRYIDEQEHYDLYKRYIDSRHSDGDMYPPSANQFRDFICSTLSGNTRDGANNCTRFIEFRLDGKLLCCAVVDHLLDGLSAIYSYFDPEESHRGLGTFAILKQIELVRRTKLSYLYLGFWVKDSAKMAYKINFQPTEFYVNKHWLTLAEFDEFNAQQKKQERPTLKTGNSF